jgi:hypothetical protein
VEEKFIQKKLETGIDSEKNKNGNNSPPRCVRLGQVLKVLEV